MPQLEKAVRHSWESMCCNGDPAERQINTQNKTKKTKTKQQQQREREIKRQWWSYR